MGTKLIHLLVVGLYPTPYYQRAKQYAKYLFAHKPNIFLSPTLRPMLDVQWTDFLTKCRRNLGTPVWKLNVPVAVFMNDKFLGSDEDLALYCSNYYGFHLHDDFAKNGEIELFKVISNSERSHIYFVISINELIIGTLLVELYNDLVPLTCNNFLRLVHLKKNGYRNSRIHRVAKYGWLQVGGCKLAKQLQTCENYYVHHDKRGVLSMTNGGKHSKNSTQFFISLQPSPWMDYYYVAFGQVLHGEDVLQKIENIGTSYECPEKAIKIEDCGEYTFVQEIEAKYAEEHQKFINMKKENLDDKEQYFDDDDDVDVLYKACQRIEPYPDDVSDLRDADSILSFTKYHKGVYSV